MDVSDPQFEAAVRYRRGDDPWGVALDMVRDGFEPDAAHAAVEAVHRRMVKADRARGAMNLVGGLSIFGVSLFFVLWTLGSPAREVIIGWSIIGLGSVWALIGFVRALAGLSQLLKAGKDSELAKI